MVYLKELSYYANLAKEILENNTKYQKDKQIISDMFESKKNTIDVDTVIFRLTIIDSYYSTQMNKRLFGIEEIAEEILKISNEDEVLRKKFRDFIDTPDEHREILKLFSSQYGCDKAGEKARKASSLISKYAYFLTNFEFPIYDRFVRISYSPINKLYEYKLPNLSEDCDKNYFQSISCLNKISKINNFDMLDNLLWLYGKLNKGSFSIILNKKKYLQLVEPIEFNAKVQKKEKSGDKENKDKEIREYIEKNVNNGILNNVFTDNTIEFINFCFKK